MLLRATFFSLMLLWTLACSSSQKVRSTSSSSFNWCKANEETVGVSLTDSGETLSRLAEINDCYGNKLPDDSVNESTVGWLVIESGTTEAKVYNGVGRYGNCTATLLDVGGDSSAPAYILTNGHCIGKLLGAEEVWKDHDTYAKTMTFNYFKDNPTSTDRIVIEDKLIKYAVMHNTDFAIIELDTTFKALTSRGVSSFKIASAPPTFASMIEIVGVPQTGMDASNLGLRKSVCQILENVAIKEGVYSFGYAYRTYPCSIVGGNSGSPVLNHQTREIVAILNTTVNDSTDGQADCVLDNPCEVSSDGTKFRNTEVNYAQPIVFIKNCFTSSGVFDSTLSTCTMNPDPKA